MSELPHLMDMLKEELILIFEKVTLDSGNPDRNPPREHNIYFSTMYLHWWYQQPYNVVLYHTHYMEKNNDGSNSMPVMLVHSTYNIFEPDSIIKLFETIRSIHAGT